MSDDRALLDSTADVPDAGTPPPEQQPAEQQLASVQQPSEVPDLPVYSQDEVVPTRVLGVAKPQPKPISMWQRVVQGALVGMAGGAGARNFAQGVSGGIHATLNQRQIDVENQQRQKQLDMHQQQLAMEQTRTMDAHQLAQAQMATATIHQRVLQAQYNTMPKSVQEMIDQSSMKAGADVANRPGTVMKGDGLTFEQANALMAAEMKNTQGTPLSVQKFMKTDGTWFVADIPNVDKLNDVPVEVTESYDLKTGLPIKQKYAAGTISYAAQLNKEATAITNGAAAKNQLEIHRQQSAIDTAAAGTRAYNEQAGRNKADMQTFTDGTPGGGPSLIDQIGTGKIPLVRMEYLLAKKPNILAAVTQKYPEFDGGKVGAYVQTRKTFASGKESVALNSGATAMEHLGELRQLNTPASLIPHTAAWTAYQNKVDTLSTELARFYGDVTIPAIAAIKSTLNATLPGNREAAIKTQAQSMGRKFDNYEQQWNDASPSPAYHTPMPGVSVKAKGVRAQLDPEYGKQHPEYTHKAGDQVTLKDGQTVTIKSINPDGTITY